ncbi:MAG: hypothetical protein ACRDZX_05545 [Acidimicrobiales bacterium]
MRGLHRVTTTVAITPATTVASPERSTPFGPKCQRGGSPTPPVAKPDFMGLFV